MGVMSAGEFEPRTVDKVERLLDLLEEMERHPALRGKLALHGGTAINLFMLDAPRLSVDIDVSYIGSVSREDMLADRPHIEAVARAQGYAVEAHLGGAVDLLHNHKAQRHSGRWHPNAPRAGSHTMARSKPEHHHGYVSCATA